MVHAPIPFRLSGPMALRAIREIARDSSRVIVTAHAQLRMRQRHISLPQVLHCLQRGQLAENPRQDIHGNWVCEIRWRHAGDFMKIVAALKHEPSTGRKIIIITVMYED